MELYSKVLQAAGGIIIMMLSPFFVSASLYGQLLDPVSFQFEELPSSVLSGEIFTITVRAEIEQDWHLYSTVALKGEGPIPTAFGSAGYSLAVVGPVAESAPETAWDPNFGREVGWHTVNALFRIPVVLHAPEGSTEIRLRVRYQSCDSISCLPPRDKVITGRIHLEGDQES